MDSHDSRLQKQSIEADIIPSERLCAVRIIRPQQMMITGDQVVDKIDSIEIDYEFLNDESERGNSHRLLSAGPFPHEKVNIGPVIRSRITIDLAVVGDGDDRSNGRVIPIGVAERTILFQPIFAEIESKIISMIDAEISKNRCRPTV